MTIQSVSKCEVATRQLRAAIRLYFEDAEPLAIHTLAGAAHGLLRDLLRRRASPPSSHVEAGVASDKVAFVAKMVGDAKNFFKHADRDPEGVLSFNTDWTDFLLYDAIAMHVRLTLELTREDLFFIMWITAKYPTVLLLDELTEGRIDELRQVFPKLASVDVQKRTFLRALNNESP
jgi:hypothetical protein